MVSALATIALTLAQPAMPTEAPAMLECSLVTPAGDSVGFWAPHWDENSDEIMLVQGEGSIWPNRTLPGQSGIMTGTPHAARMFAFGSGDGLALDLGERGGDQTSRVATLYRRERQNVGLPLAFGFCRKRTAQPYIYRQVDVDADPRDIGANIPAFDPVHWPAADCGLILSDGRRVPFRFSLSGQDEVRLSSPELWAGHPVTMAIRWGTIDGAQSGSFVRRGGPEGVQTMVVSGTRGAKLIRLRQIVGRTGRDQTGFAICGYSQMVRRAD
jgi:hypothetical protein